MVAMNKIEQKAARTVQRAMYAPRPRPALASRETETALDVKLRKLTAKVLEDLKLPSAVPSKVIAQALREARSL